MSISIQAKNWIEDNIDYLDRLNWDKNECDLVKLLRKVPANIFMEIKNILTKIDIKLSDNQLGIMYGVKSINGDRTSVIGRYIDGRFNMNVINSNGVRSGYQIGFKSISAALGFIDVVAEKSSIIESLRPSIMYNKIADKYDWIEVDSQYGKCWITDVAYNRYNPDNIKKRQILKKADADIFNASVRYLTANFDLNKATKSLQNYFGELPERNSIRFNTNITVSSHYNSKLGIIYVKDLYADEPKVSIAISILEKEFNCRLNLLDMYRSTNFGNYLNNVVDLYLIPDIMDFNILQKNIYAKYNL